MTADAAWIRTDFEMAGRRVGVAVRRLDPDEQRRVAAEIAWFADELCSPVRPASGWPSFLERILLHDVRITLDERQWAAGDGAWEMLVCRAFETFVTANELDAEITRHLHAAPRTAPPRS